MIEWLMIPVGGLLGSAHCVGMCGGFALTLGAGQPGLIRNLGRQLIYSMGRVFTYVAGGAVVGYGGWRLSGELPSVVNAQGLLSVLAGILLIAQGLLATGVLRWPWPATGVTSCPGARSFAVLLLSPRLRQVFVAGLLNGLLPCGLVYAYLALAASSGDLVRGSATMGLFGLGTIPVLVLTGCGGTILTRARRLVLFRVAAWCLVLTGGLALVRGVTALTVPGADGTPACPLCP